MKKPSLRGALLASSMFATIGIAHPAFAQDSTVIIQKDHEAHTDKDHSKTVIKRDDGSKTVTPRPGSPRRAAMPSVQGGPQRAINTYDQNA